MNKEIEEWKDIKEYEGLYQISNFGRVKSLSKYVNTSLKYTNIAFRKEKILKNVNNMGYLLVSLSKNKKHITKHIHRLVAETFIPNPKNYKEVNHKDGNKLNNNVSNLEWCSHSHNIKHAHFNKLIIPHYKKINQYDLDGNFIRTWNSISEAVRETNINGSAIIRCCKEKYKQTGGYGWKYAK